MVDVLCGVTFGRAAFRDERTGLALGADSPDSRRSRSRTAGEELGVPAAVGAFSLSGSEEGSSRRWLRRALGSRRSMWPREAEVLRLTGEPGAEPLLALSPLPQLPPLAALPGPSMVAPG